jgi:16S rRNA (guanine1207-N2)-methyltransferase
MFDKRLSVLKENFPGLFAGNKSICFINPRDLTDLAHFKIRNTVVFTDDIRMYSPLSVFGYNCEPEANLVVDISIVLLPKSKELARELVFMGFMMSPEGFVVIDGDKKDGIVSIIKELEEEICYEVNLSKAHGKIAVFRPGNGNLPLNWHASKSNKVNNEFITVPGVFSADHIDPASELLKKYLPK